MRSNGQNEISHHNNHKKYNSKPLVCCVFGTSSSQSENVQAGPAQLDDRINDRPYNHTNLAIGATTTTLRYEAATHVAFLKFESWLKFKEGIANRSENLSLVTSVAVLHLTTTRWCLDVMHTKWGAAVQHFPILGTSFLIWLISIINLSYFLFPIFLFKINHTIVQRMNIEPILEANEIDVDKLSICTKVHLQSNS